VLDRLLEDERILFEGISATSAGAMNATVTAYGMAAGGRQGARQALTNFWRRVSHAADFSPLQPSWFDRMTENRSLDNSPAYVFMDMMTRLFSPYQFNSANYNPLRDVLVQVVDFEALRRRSCPVKLFLSATNVRTGKVKVFDNDEITADSVLASCCLPFLFQAVEIDGESYWDGGYMGNPAIFPLIYNCGSADVVIVHINPMKRPDMPRTATEILNRINEISFNSSLMREMRAIHFVTDLIDADLVKTSVEEDVHPRHLGRGGDVEAEHRQQAQRRLGFPHRAARHRTCHRRTLAVRELQRPRPEIDGGYPRDVSVAAAGRLVELS
jgi:NTE family protein